MGRSVFDQVCATRCRKQQRPLARSSRTLTQTLVAPAHWHRPACFSVLRVAMRHRSTGQHLCDKSRDQPRDRLAAGDCGCARGCCTGHGRACCTALLRCESELACEFEREKGPRSRTAADSAVPPHVMWSPRPVGIAALAGGICGSLSQ